MKISYTLTHLPKIEVISPDLKLIKKKPPHVYTDNDLCLFYPKNKEWTKYDYISDKIIPWISTWLYFYEIWDITGEWLGGGKHPGSNDKKRNLDKYIN